MNKPVILITGASRGIGAKTALLAARRGYRVALNFLRSEAASIELADQIAQLGSEALLLQADIASEMEVASMFDELDRNWGCLNALVNNAGVLETQTRLEGIDGTRLQRIFSTNVFGSFYCARQAVRRMSTRHGGPGGSIVNVSSAAARNGSPNEYIDYAASKGAIDSMTLGLAAEVAQEGIRVNAVRPGFIYTEMHAAGGEPKRVDRVARMVPMQRGGNPEEVAEAILWLLSDAASYCTGSFIDVTGGR
jgi:NAD(P)-dependent dehydrogenase (short-subunit alcohol dehydrogenase family)